MLFNQQFSFRGAYTRVPTEPPISTSSIHSSQCKAAHPRWSSQEFRGREGVQESRSTEPLLPSPTSGSIDIANIPPPCLYTDPVLPLNPARLAPTGFHDRQASRGASANASAGAAVPNHVGVNVCDQRASLYAVSNRPYDTSNPRVESKTYPSNEISV